MKIVNYTSRDTKDTRAILLCEGEEGDLLLLPPKIQGEIPCLIISSPNIRSTYQEGAWTNVGFSQLNKLEATLKEALCCKLKIPDVEEYKLYLKLKKKFGGKDAS
jgi:hypothetical protein